MSGLSFGIFAISWLDFDVQAHRLFITDHRFPERWAFRYIFTRTCPRAIQHSRQWYLPSTIAAFSPNSTEWWESDIRSDASSLLAIIEKTHFFELPIDRYRRGTEGNGSIQRLWRPQIAHWHTVARSGGAGEVIGTTPICHGRLRIYHGRLRRPFSIALLTTPMKIPP
jgi:hypothetical protein